MADLAQQAKMGNISFVYKINKKETLSDYLKRKCFSSDNIHDLILNKHVVVNKKVINDRNITLYRNDALEVTLNDEINEIEANEGFIDVVYEDEYILIVNKEKGINIEPVRFHLTDTLANKIVKYYKDNNILSKIHYINRLDKDTKGLVILAKNQYIHNVFKTVKIDKRYVCSVKGKTPIIGYIKIKLKKNGNEIKRIVSKDGKICKTVFRRISYKNNKSIVDVKLLTGRTHQIRASFAYINHPLVGDNLYGDYLKNDMDLFAYYLSFVHPISKKRIIINQLKK